MRQDLESKYWVRHIEVACLLIKSGAPLQDLDCKLSSLTKLAKINEF